MTATENNVAAQAGDEPMPCPFCGGAPVIDGKDEYVRIRCEGCGVAGQARYFSSDSEEAIEWAEVDAIKLWNHRVSPRATADVERDAARWRALLDSARIRMIGSAGLMRPMPNNYAHFGMEIWTKYGTSLNAEQAQQMADGNVRGREWITKYADIAIEAQRATTKPGA